VVPTLRAEAPLAQLTLQTVCSNCDSFIGG
jgi:hypothetical protein